MKHVFFTLVALFISFASFATGPILGTAAICAGSTTSLSDATPSGTWASSNTTVGTVGPTGIVTGVAAGTTTITYDVSGVYSTLIVTVNPIPSPISGTPIVCLGSTTVLTDAAGGGVWSSATPSIATVTTASGIVTGMSVGTTNISYALATGCATTIVVTVNAAPAPITGVSSLCVGGTATVTGTPIGGTWSVTPSTVASVFGAGILYGNAAGTATITYTSSAGCYATMTVTVSATTPPITGTTAICAGYTTTLSDAAAGGTWSSSSSGIATVGVSSGIVTGAAGGTATITYTQAGGCIATTIVTVNPGPGAISGPSIICGSSVTYTDAATGGIWSTSTPSVLTISGAGVATGITIGTTYISYTIGTGCFAVLPVTVNAFPAMISGPSLVCAGSSITLNDVVTGGTWSSSSTVVASIYPSSGVLTGNIAGPATITYQLGSGCFASTSVTVNGIPTISATSTANCGGTYTLNGSGAGTGGTYTWASATGLSCTACGTTVATIITGVTYTVTGTDVNGCTNTNTVTLNGNRISGYISLTAAPTDTLKVWLIQFNSTDSSIIAQDSSLSCMDSGTPYYEFDSKPAGNYMVKAKLLSSVPGTSGYIPTYGLSSSVWDSAATITHASATDTQHINMLYGTVPSGPGFIGGLISSGAGRGTSGSVPAIGMLVYLKNAASNILTYTYTDATGAYSFNGIANGTYNIYPMDYDYHTTPWVSVTLSSSAETVTHISFYEHTGLHTITPTGTTLCCGTMTTTQINLYPNPTVNELNINWTDEKTGDATIMITDITGREVYKSVLNINAPNGNTQLDIHNLDNGIYFITIKSGSISYINKLQIQR